MSALTVDSTDRLLTDRAGTTASPDLAGHLATHGPLDLPRRVDPQWRSGMWRAVSESGLLGRGGAGFPSGAKWDALRHSGRRPIVVVNAMEGEPASAKDRVLLTYSPHLVVDGAEVAAAVVGASEIVICVADHSGSAASTLEAAIAERERAGRSRIRTSVVRPPGRYVTGEESALVSWLNEQPARPVMRVDKSVPLRVGRRPVVVHNAETLSQVALIARHGPEWFRRLGTPDAPGSTLVTVSGAVRYPGVLEVEMGTPVIDILERAGRLSALGGVLVGGYGGAWLDPSRLATPLAPGPLAAAGATLGVGILIALPVGSCGIAETARIARYMAGESAGQCGPCVFGLPAIAGDLEQLWAGQADTGLLERIRRRADAVDGRGACRHPDGVVRLVRSALAVFGDDARSHAEGRPCAGCASPTVLTLPTPAAGRPIAVRESTSSRRRAS
jgi:NADH:ubiquinone oxidoreductase subunit F (NADH-binding)